MKKTLASSFVKTVLTIISFAVLILALAGSVKGAIPASQIETPLPAGSGYIIQPTPTPEWTPPSVITATQYVPTTLPMERLPELQTPLEEAVRAGILSFTAAGMGTERPLLPITLSSFAFDGDTLTLDISGADALGESEWNELIHAIDQRVTESLYSLTSLQGLSIEYYLLLDGHPLEDVLPVGSAMLDSPPEEAPQATEGIQGQKIVLNPGHGYYKRSNNAWYLQRSYYYGIVEDFINLDLVIDLNRFVRASGGNTYSVRQLNKSAGNHSPSNYPWWQMGASEYVRSLGAPESVWLPLPYSSIYDHDIAARPEYANWIGANSLVSIHNNGGGSAACNGHGTEVWYDSGNGYQSQSQSLASAIHAKLIQRLRDQWDGGWCDRGIKGANGSYGENRRFRGPAVIVELAFMDVPSDNSALQNAAFRAIAMAAVNEAIVQYYGGVTCPTITGWRAEYWNNRDLSGLPVMCRNESNVSFDWGSSGPSGAVLNDHFSARWTRTINLTSGNYRFHVRADDGVRLWVDDSQIINKWQDQGATEYTYDLNLLGGNHSVKMEYYERGGGAVAQFWYERLGAYCPTISAWKGEYWNNTGHSGQSTLCRSDNNVNFDWGSGGPGGGVQTDNFSARWTRTLYFNAGTYRFHLRGDDGIRLWIDGTRVIDQWRDQGPTEYLFDITLSGGNHSMRVDYYEHGGGAVVQLWWELINFAQGKPSWATSDQSWWDYRASKGNDGNYSTRWSSRWSANAVGEWWWVEVGTSQTYDRVVIQWETAYASRHFVGYSIDGQNFYGSWYSISSAGRYGYNIGSRNAKYVGVYMTSRAPCCGNYSFWEFEVYRTSVAMALNEEVEASEEMPYDTQDVIFLEPLGEPTTLPGPTIPQQNQFFFPVVR